MVVAIAVAMALCACGTKKNTAMSRNWQAFTTRYNVYFNGDQHYKETIKTMEGTYEDDYTRQVLMHPAEAKANAKLPQPQGDFKRTIEKMQKAIQLHSIKKKPVKKSGSKKEKEFRSREEFNPFLHNAWMMLGKGQFMNGDFLGAASTFFYISKHFKWLPATVLEAQLWEARCYCAMDWNYEAENILQKIKPDKIESSKLKHFYNEVQADYLVRTEQYEKAVPYLELAAKGSHGTQKNRQWFLLGQVYNQLGKKKLAYEAFRKAGSGASTPYRAKFNARIKQSEVYEGTNIKGEVNALRSMARYERNKEYQDQIYYAIGNLYLSRRDTTKAVENYKLAVEKSTRNGIDKALAQLALGSIYFNRREYVEAQPCYSEAVPQLAENYPDYKVLKKRSDVLDELATYAGNVDLQDSLLTLSKLTPEEQLKVCQRLADELIKKEKEEQEAAKREEYLAQQQGNNPITDKNAPTTFQMNNDKSWYFYNTQAKNTGKTEFQRKWGARKLEDDWRRRNKNSFSFDEIADDSSADGEAGQDGANGEGEEQTQEQKDSIAAVQDPHKPEYYMAQIPKTEEQIKTCNDIVQEGLYNMGVILKDKLEDFPAARAEFTELDTRYPDNIYRLDVYYNMYLMAVRKDETAEAEKYRQLILTEFPESAYGKAMADPNYFTNLRRMHQIQEELYQDTYDAYLANENDKVRRLTSQMEKDYPLSPLLPKFVFLDALSYVADGDTENFRARLTELLQKWPETDMTEVAGGMLKNLKNGLVIKGGGSNSRGMIWDTRLTTSTDENGDSKNGQPANFENDPNSPQYLVYAFPRDSVNANQLLYEVARFNFTSFVTGDYDLEQMSFGNVGLLIIKGFSNVKRLEHYRTVMSQSSFKLPSSVRPIMISKPNFELLLREGRSFDEYFRFEEEAAVEATEHKVVEAEDADGQVEEDSAGDDAEKNAEQFGPEGNGEPEESAPEQIPAQEPAQEAATQYVEEQASQTNEEVEE